MCILWTRTGIGTACSKEQSIKKFLKEQKVIVLDIYFFLTLLKSEYILQFQVSVGQNSALPQFGVFSGSWWLTLF